MFSLDLDREIDILAVILEDVRHPVSEVSNECPRKGSPLYYAKNTEIASRAQSRRGGLEVRQRWILKTQPVQKLSHCGGKLCEGQSKALLRTHTHIWCIYIACLQLIQALKVHHTAVKP